MTMLPVLLMGSAQAQDSLLLRGNIDQIAATLDSLRAEEVRKAVRDTCFVIEAELVSVDGHHPVSVSSRNNFFLVDKTESTLQTSFNIGRSGLNGMGGVTLDGNVGKYDVSADEEGSVRLDMVLNGIGASGNVFIIISPDGNTVRLSFMPTFRSGQVTMTGRLVSKERSDVFKGRALL